MKNNYKAPPSFACPSCSGSCGHQTNDGSGASGALASSLVGEELPPPQAKEGPPNPRRKAESRGWTSKNHRTEHGPWQSSEESPPRLFQTESTPPRSAAFQPSPWKRSMISSALETWNGEAHLCDYPRRRWEKLMSFPEKRADSKEKAGFGQGKRLTWALDMLCD